MAKIDRDRLNLALEDRPLKSDLEAMSDLHERRLRTAEAELRQHGTQLCSRLQVCRVCGHMAYFHDFHDTQSIAAAFGCGAGKRTNVRSSDVLLLFTNVV